MSVVHRCSILWLLAVVALSGCALNESFIDSRARQHKNGNVVICRTGDESEVVKSRTLAEQTCRENWLPAPALMSSTPYGCAVTAHVRDVYQCGGRAPEKVNTVLTPLTSYSSVSDQIKATTIESEDDRPQIFSNGE